CAFTKPGIMYLPVPSISESPTNFSLVIAAMVSALIAMLIMPLSTCPSKSHTFSITKSCRVDGVQPIRTNTVKTNGTYTFNVPQKSRLCDYMASHASAPYLTLAMAIAPRLFETFPSLLKGKIRQEQRTDGINVRKTGQLENSTGNQQHDRHIDTDSRTRGICQYGF